MSLSNKSLEKSKRFVGVKANDFVAKNRTTDANRSNVRPQGWANLGKINSRRIPPPANVPSLKSESGSQPSVYDPTVPSNHGWTSNSSPDIAPSQQQLDAFTLQSSAPSTPIVSSTENEKIRPQTSWSSVTAASTNPEPIPNLLALNDFPRLATTQDRRSSPNENNPSFRPTNLSSWKDGGSRIQPLMSDAPVQLMSPSNLRQYSPQSMWAQPVPSSRLNNVTEYKTPTILRNKDIDDLSKLTENSWANASEEINYEEKIRFSDEEDRTDLAAVPLPNSNKSRRLIQEDEHFRQMQDEKNSELINALSIAKQRRDEQERHLKKHSHDEQEEFPRRANEGSRTRHDTANSQTFSMKSWSEQMDSFNYASLHDKSENKNETKEFPRSTSDSSSPTPQEKTKKVKTRLIQSRTYPKNDSKVRPVDPPSSSTRPSTKGKSNRNAQQWSPTPRASDSAEHPTRYPIDTSSIPPLMSVCSDPTSTAHLFENSHSTGPYAQPYSYTALGSYGRYRRGGNAAAAAAAPTHRPQGQNDYSSYPSTIPTKKNRHQSKTLIEEGKISPLMSKSIDFPLEPMKKSSDVDSNENSTKTKMTNGKQRRNQREPLAFYQAPRHRNNYPQAMATHSSSAVDRNFSSEYESVPTQHYYNHSRRNAPMQHEFYEHPQQQHYNHYSKGESSGTTRISTKKPSKRSSATTKTRFNNGNHSNPRAHSTSDNDPKEGEEWETASESSTNLRNGHEENAHSSNKGDHRGRTPPKKNFTQRPHTRQIFKYTNA